MGKESCRISETLKPGSCYPSLQPFLQRPHPSMTGSLSNTDPRFLSSVLGDWMEQGSLLSPSFTPSILPHPSIMTGSLPQRFFKGKLFLVLERIFSSSFFLYISGILFEAYWMFYAILCVQNLPTEILAANIYSYLECLVLPP